MKAFIQKHSPGAFAALKKIYHCLLDLYIEIKGTSFHADDWKDRRAQEEHFEEVIRHPSRKLILDNIGLETNKTFFEYGCAQGQNLLLIKENSVDAACYGVDISKSYIEFGKEKTRQGGFENVHLFTLEDLDAVPEVDVVFTCAVLILINKEDIQALLEELLSRAKKRLLLIEYHDDSYPALGKVKEKYSMRNYEKLLLSIDPSLRLSIEPVPAELWGDNWAKYGKVIVAEKA